MKSRNTIFVGLIAVIMCVSPALQAQDDVTKLLQESVKDGEYLLEGYLNPVMKSISLGVNQGWHNTAASHKLGGFDLTITTSLMYIPDKDMFYHVDNSRLTSVRLTAPTSGNVPTIIGPKTQPTYTPNNTSIPAFQGPGGLDLKGELGRNIFPVPIANFGIGLPKGTDLKIRYVPTIKAGSKTTFNLFGVGVMHDIKQYIPGLRLVPLDLSGFVGYTHMKLEKNIQEIDYGNYPNQKGIIEISSATIQGLISKKFSVLTAYAGVGYNIAKSSIGVKGTYDFNVDGDTNDPGEKDPLGLKFAASGPRVTAGLRLKLAVFTFHADYTLQQYSALTVGFGISVR